MFKGFISMPVYSDEKKKKRRVEKNESSSWGSSDADDHFQANKQP